MLAKNYRAGLQKVALLRKDSWWYYVDKPKRKDVKQTECSIFSSQASSLIKLRMQENQIVISAQDIDFSTSAEETQVCQYAGAAMSIGFKSTFLIDILNNISADEVVIELADPSRAGVIIPVEQEENEDLLMLLMPMMLND